MVRVDREIQRRSGAVPADRCAGPSSWTNANRGALFQPVRLRSWAPRAGRHAEMCLAADDSAVKASFFGLWSTGPFRAPWGGGWTAPPGHARERVRGRWGVDRQAWPPKSSTRPRKKLMLLFEHAVDGIEEIAAHQGVGHTTQTGGKSDPPKARSGGVAALPVAVRGSGGMVRR